MKKNIDTNKLNKVTEKMLVIRLKTISLNKLESKFSSNDICQKDKAFIAAYCFFAKKEDVSKIKHPNLYSNMIKFEKALNLAIEDDPYYESYNVLLKLRDKKKNSLAFKKDARLAILEILNKNKDISIRMISERVELKYANVYNFLIKEKYTDISVKNTHILFWETLGIKEGWTKSETKENHKTNFKKIQNYWNIDEDNIKEE